MASFLTTIGTSNQIEKILIEAKKELVLISPFLKISKTFFERLNDASKRDVRIKIVYGKDELRTSEQEQLKRLNNLELFFFENLHAKSYYNESEMVITSMNMYEFSEKNNREMGVFIRKNGDRKLYMDAVDETMSIVNNSCCRFKSENLNIQEKDKEKVETEIINRIDSKDKNTAQKEGFCIRCGDDLSFKPYAPYCNSCYNSWIYWGNRDFEEKFCHGCGEKIQSTMDRPLCHSCYSNLSDKDKRKLQNSGTF